MSATINNRSDHRNFPVEPRGPSDSQQTSVRIVQLGDESITHPNGTNQLTDSQIHRLACGQEVALGYNHTWPTSYPLLTNKGDALLNNAVDAVLMEMFGPYLLQRGGLINHLVGNKYLAKQALRLKLNLSRRGMDLSSHWDQQGRMGDNYEAYLALLYFYRGGESAVLDEIRPWVYLEALDLIQSGQVNDVAAKAFIEVGEWLGHRPATKLTAYRKDDQTRYRYVIGGPTNDGWGCFVIGEADEPPHYSNAIILGSERALAWIRQHPR